MGADLVGQRPAVRALYDRANAILGYDLAGLCFNGPVEELNSTVRSQPALFVTSLAALECLREDQPAVVENCGAVAGLSLGEYTALVFAGVLEFEDGLRLVQERGAAMQAASDQTPSGMFSVLGAEAEQVEQLCAARRQGDVLELANLLCPGNIAVSGSKAACERLVTAATEAGLRVVPLAVAGAFHTSIMGPAVERLQAALQAVTLKPPRIPVISNVDARPHNDPAEIRELLVKQVCSQVLWQGSMQWLLDQGYETFYEVGPGRVLRGLLKRINRRVECQGVIS
jgi:[acyl-carrier-protein] S-malonyltransferase